MICIDADLTDTAVGDITEPAPFFDDNNTTLALREQHRRDIAQQTAAYLAAGKKITVIAMQLAPQVAVLPRHTKPTPKKVG